MNEHRQEKAAVRGGVRRGKLVEVAYRHTVIWAPKTTMMYEKHRKDDEAVREARASRLVEARLPCMVCTGKRNHRSASKVIEKTTNEDRRENEAVRERVHRGKLVEATCTRAWNARVHTSIYIYMYTYTYLSISGERESES